MAPKVDPVDCTVSHQVWRDGPAGPTTERAHSISLELVLHEEGELASPTSGCTPGFQFVVKT